MIYVVTTISTKELDAAAMLRRSGYEAYVPRAMRRVRKGKECYYTAEVMFDGYVFVSLPGELTADDYYKIRSVKLIGNFLSKRAALSDEESEYVRMLCNNGQNVGVSSGYVKGGKLYITDGWLKQFEDKIVRWSVRQHKATVELTLHGEPHRITCTVDITK